MFCKTVWNGLHILPDGYIRLCSIGSNSKPALDLQRCRDRDGNVMHILTHSIQDIMNSDKHREVRLLNSTIPGAWSPHCSCCEIREMATDFDRDHKNKSRRIYLMNVDTTGLVEETSYANKMQPDGSIDYMPASLDIRFGNLCNQKCIMCSPAFSNMWYDEWFDFNKSNTFGQGKRIIALRDEKTEKWKSPIELQWYDDPRWWPKFEEMMPHLKHIYITGGEPMVTPAHDVMLDKLIDSGNAKNVWLEYDTNCSAINDKIAQRWKHFKSVHIRGSMDATNEQYELIRYPGNWEKFKKNIEKLKDYSKESNGKIKLLALTSCFQLTTAYSTIESEEWCKTIGIDFHLRFLEGPAYHSIASLPIKSKEVLLNYFKAHETTSAKAPMIIKYLERQIFFPGNTPELRKFIKFMDYLDGTRGTNWRLVFPDIYKLVLSSGI